MRYSKKFLFILSLSLFMGHKPPHVLGAERTVTDGVVTSTKEAIQSDSLSLISTEEVNPGKGSIPDSTSYTSGQATPPKENNVQDQFFGSESTLAASEETTGISEEYTSGETFSNSLAETETQNTSQGLYTVNYSLNGGTGTLPSSAVYTPGEFVPLSYPSDLFMENHTFAGWAFTDYAWSPDFPIGETHFTMESDNITLYAVWIEDDTYQINYAANGGMDGPKDNNLYYRGDTAQVLFSPIPTFEHHTFIGWSPTPDSPDAFFRENARTTFTIQSDVILYAIWREDPYLTLHYNSNGGNGGPSDETHYYEGDKATLAFHSLPTRPHYTFLGWADDADAKSPSYTSDGTNYIDVRTQGKNEIRTMYAIWGKETAKKVTYHTGTDNTGIAPVDETDYYSGDSVVVDFSYQTSDPNLTFLGWTTEIDSTVILYRQGEKESFVMEDRSVDLYPVFSTDTSLTGTASLQYSAINGTLTASVEFGTKEPDTFLIQWVRDGSHLSVTGNSIQPDKPGEYKCIIHDSSNTYTDTITSPPIRLYQVATTDPKVTFSNKYGIYQAGDMAQATYESANNLQFTSWQAEGILLSDKEKTSNPLVFSMPIQNIQLKAEAAPSYAVSISGGIADKYLASPGETVSIRANELSGMIFSKWIISGIELSDITAPVASFTMPDTNVSIRASYIKPVDTAPNTSTRLSDYNKDMLIYSVLDSGGYQVRMEHAEQGPLCEDVFKNSSKGYSIYEKYYNLLIGDTYPPVYETPLAVTIRLNIPETLRSHGRTFRMVCVSKDGIPYLLQDTDSSDDTITFTTSHYYAMALTYTDYVAPIQESTPISSVSNNMEENEEPTNTVKYEEPDDYTSSYFPVETSTIRNADDSQVLLESTESKLKEVNNSQTGFAVYTPIVRSSQNKSDSIRTSQKSSRIQL